MLSSQVLVLNRSYIPIQVTSLKRALCLLYRGLAKVVDQQYELFDFQSWAELSVVAHDESLGLVHKAIRIPRVILLHFYDKVPNKPVRFSRLNVYLRDQNTCQYCRKKFPRSELTLDHVLPLSRGGGTSWENIVCCCVVCNVQKGGKTPQEARLHMMRVPMRPDWSFMFRILTKPIHYKEWFPYLNILDYSYWNNELES